MSSGLLLLGRSKYSCSPREAQAGRAPGQLRLHKETLSQNTRGKKDLHTFCLFFSFAYFWDHIFCNSGCPWTHGMPTVTSHFWFFCLHLPNARIIGVAPCLGFCSAGIECRDVRMVSKYSISWAIFLGLNYYQREMTLGWFTMHVKSH